jgi:outer membrane protein TolC
MTDFFSHKKAGVLFLFMLSQFPSIISAQDTQNVAVPNIVTLKQAVDYAVKNQPRIQQALLDEQITASTIRSKLADWYPQVNFNYGLQHNFLLQTSVIGGNPIKLGVDNTSSGQFSVSQAIFNRDVLLARRTKEDVLLQSKQVTSSNKIDLEVSVSKAFYDVLATSQQIKIAAENITRIERSLRDATSQYKAGIADKIDYKRATISLNNSRANKKINEELIIAKKAYLKFLMGFPDSAKLDIAYDSLAMEKEIWIDTLQQPDIKNRIEYRLLETQRKLQESNVLYNRWSYLPSVSANAAYNLNFQNDQFSKLYSANFPNSFAALTVSLPLFQGGKRKANLHTATLQLQRTDQDIINLQNSVKSQYAQALATYKSSLQTYLAQQENVALAKEVYDVIQLQYRSGIKTYLEVITAETDLRTAEINYYNALYQVLAGKVDVQRALGQITY